MSSGYWPTNDDQFSAWMARFDAYLNVHFAEYGLTQADVDLVHDTQLPAWTAALATHQVTEQTAKAATASKKAARATLESTVRGMIRQIDNFRTTTDADREAFGLPPKDAAPVSSGVELGEEKPLALIDISSRQQHVLRVVTKTATGTKRGRPAGTSGAEVWRKVGEAPVGTEGMEYVGIAKGSPLVIEYGPEDAGKLAHYALRWLDGKGVPGAWSETESATIAA